jgi:hypothetical protein
VASLKGKGFDLRLNSINTNGAIKWETAFALSHAKVTVTKFDNGGFKASQFLNSGVNPREGQIAWGLASYKFAGLDPLTGDPQGIYNGAVSKNYVGILNDSIGNQVFHGSAIPLYSGFIFNTVSWRRLSLSANITYRLNFYFRKTTIDYNLLYNSWVGHPDYALRWQKPGDEAHTTVPSMNYPASINRDLFYTNSEVTVKKGDNIRLRDIRLAYQWQNNSAKRVPFKSIQVYLYANDLNVIIWRKEKSVLDPDYPVSATPPPRTLTAGVNLNF